MNQTVNQTKELNKQWKKILRFILLVICGAVFGMNIYLANASTLVGNKMPMPFGYGMAVVLSGSMEPEFSTGDLIIVRETTEFNEKDIVVFQDGSMLVVHRIVSIKDDIVITKGDANNMEDDPVPISSLKGTVIGCIPYVGTIVNMVKTPLGTMATIALAIALIEIPRIKEKEKDDEERQKIIDEIRRLKNED